MPQFGHVKRGLAAVGALAALGLVAVVLHAPGPQVVLSQGETIVDQINDKFMAKMEKKQHDADLATVREREAGRETGREQDEGRKNGSRREGLGE